MRSFATSPSPNSLVSVRSNVPAGLVVLGNPEGRRLALLAEALARCGQPPPRVVSYIEYLRHEVRLADVLESGAVLRIESPGQNLEVERAILAAGYDPAGSSEFSPQQLGRMALERGRILGPRQWYAGFTRLLDRIAADRAQAGAHAVFNDEPSIALLFDKVRCHSRLEELSIPCPRSLGPVGSYEELRDRMRAEGVGRVFVKLRWGSSGSGVVALESSRARTQAFTTVEVVESGGRRLLYNSRRIRRLVDDRAIGWLVSDLAREGIHVEQWVPKAGQDGHAADLRVVVIAGVPAHAVVRLSRSPITNLHLKNRRGCVATLRARMGEPAWHDLLATCRRVGAAFPGCHYVGVDLAVLPGYLRHAVLEANAFGDQLPGVLDASGRDTYTAEIQAMWPAAAPTTGSPS